MIRKSILLLAMVLPTISALAQEKKITGNKTTITIIKQEDGKTTRIDTVFSDSDDITIEAFFEKNGVNPTPKPPPIPPTPPVPPPPPIPDQESSFNFHFKSPDFDTSLQLDIDKEMKELRESLKDLKIDIKNNLNQKELENLERELEQEMEELKKEIKKQSKHKSKIIKKKTGYSDTDNTLNTGYIYNFPNPDNFKLEVFADISDAPLLTASVNSNNHFTSVCYTQAVDKKKKSKFRSIMNKVIERILD